MNNLVQEIGYWFSGSREWATYYGVFILIFGSALVLAVAVLIYGLVWMIHRDSQPRQRQQYLLQALYGAPEERVKSLQNEEASVDKCHSNLK